MTLDRVDSEILGELGRNGRASSRVIGLALKSRGMNLTPRAIRKRIERMEKRKTIMGYSVKLNPKEINLEKRRVVLIKLKSISNFDERLSALVSYFRNSPRCAFLARLDGDIDIIASLRFPFQADGKLESDVVRSQFPDLIMELRSYEATALKET